MSKTVFVTGATGYLAKHIIGYLLTQGYSVVGSVRSSSKGDALVKLFNDPHFSYEVVEVLEVPHAFDAALAKHPEVTVFIHTASPGGNTTTDQFEKDIIVPAIDGTKFALRSIQDVAPQVTRVVLTSSVAAMKPLAATHDVTVPYSDQDFSDITLEQATSSSRAAYTASKAYSEKEAFEFVKSNKPNFTLAAVNPVFTFGPVEFIDEIVGAEKLPSTAEFVNAVLKFPKQMPRIPPFQGAYIDVRDVAKAHVLAFEKEEAQGKRILVEQEKFSFQLLLNIVRENFPDLAEGLPVGDPVVDTSKWSRADDAESRRILGIEYVPLKTSVVDLVNQVLEAKKLAG
ncbi:putative NADPH-dependent methylglyoxal reductase GRP2 [Candida viswanathii]|uniref:Putative NADPH-dependent methylglyoxal reductase GRP2 n=1 Tax=Candida viswanathii TaxID=5486 RepID=A0A367YIP6_9ASCO|nr:putative NADPH-dependent methylglyoxal reductase GRP2 [Candida viswanathii]